MQTSPGTPIMCRAPPEIIQKILSFLSPGDIVRLRTVSKQLRDITYSPTLWRTLYTNACLPRPPGPFPSQSVQFLESTLVKSERLAQSWMTRPIRCESLTNAFSVDPMIDVLPISSVKIFNNRWLVSFEAPGYFAIHDLDTKTLQEIQCSRKVHWKNHKSFQWDVTSVTSLEGLVIYVLFGAGSASPWKFLELRVDSDSKHLYLALSLTIPMEHFSQSVILDGGHGPFLRLEDVIFHVDKRRFYKFPPFRTALNMLPLGSEHREEPHILLTKTHVIVVHSFIYLTEVERTANVNLVQAFTLPCDAASNLLRLSHEGIIHGPDRFYFPEYVNIIRNSLVDPMNGETNIRLLDQTINHSSICFSCVDLTLPKHTSTELRVDPVETVLPMTIRMNEIARVGNLPLYWQYEWACHLDFSDDGFVRGVGLVHPIVKRAVIRFTVDASQEQCIATLARLRWRDSSFARLLERGRWMDSVTGKTCYTYTQARVKWISLEDFTVDNDSGDEDDEDYDDEGSDDDDDDYEDDDYDNSEDYDEDYDDDED